MGLPVPARSPRLVIARGVRFALPKSSCGLRCPSIGMAALDIFWLKDDALEESANLPAPEVIAADITADLEAAMEQFATIAEDLKK